MNLSNRFVSILPNNATLLEQHIEKVSAQVFNSENNPNLQNIKNSKTMPENLMLNLANEFQVDIWDNAYPRERKQGILANAVNIHRLKGTEFSIKRGLEIAGFKKFAITSRVLETLYNGSHKFDGIYSYGGNTNGIKIYYDGFILYNGGTNFDQPSNWAFYAVEFFEPLNKKQSLQAKEIINRLAPARCKLHLIRTRILYDNSIIYDGGYNYGGY